MKIKTTKKIESELDAIGRKYGIAAPILATAFVSQALENIKKNGIAITWIPREECPEKEVHDQNKQPA